MQDGIFPEEFNGFDFLNEELSHDGHQSPYSRWPRWWLMKIPLLRPACSSRERQVCIVQVDTIGHLHGIAEILT